jgi:hypothetical protein
LKLREYTIELLSDRRAVGGLPGAPGSPVVLGVIVGHRGIIEQGHVITGATRR